MISFAPTLQTSTLLNGTKYKHNKFYQNRSINMERADINSFTPLRKMQPSDSRLFVDLETNVDTKFNENPTNSVFADSES